MKNCNLSYVSVNMIASFATHNFHPPVVDAIVEIVVVTSQRESVSVIKDYIALCFTLKPYSQMGVLSLPTFLLFSADELSVSAQLTLELAAVRDRERESMYVLR